MQNLSSQKQNIIKELLIQGQRFDQREMYQQRESQIFFSNKNQTVLIEKQKTKILVDYKAEVVQPKRKNQNEGVLSFYLQINYPQGFTMSKEQQIKQNQQVTYLLESILKDSKSLDIQTLGIKMGQLCWSLCINASIIEQDGCFEDALLTAIIVLLQNLSVQEPIFYQENSQSKYTETIERNFYLNFLPSLKLLGLLYNYDASPVFVVDPNQEEASVCQGFIYMGTNGIGELIHISTKGNCQLDQAIIYQLVDEFLLKSKENLANQKTLVQKQNIKRIEELFENKIFVRGEKMQVELEF